MRGEPAPIRLENTGGTRPRSGCKAGRDPSHDTLSREKQQLEATVSSTALSLRQWALNALTLAGYALVIGVLLFAWTVREQRYLVAEEGLGYAIGIIGGSMMLMLLIYPLRKRRNWHFLGPVSFWFRLHMVFGIVGPALIILHSGYRVGSLNGLVALVCMLIVAASGLVGRYLYRRIHHGLYGSKIKFEEFYRQGEHWENALEQAREQNPELVDELHELEERLVTRHTGLNRSWWFYQSARRRLKKLRRQIRRCLPAGQDRKRMLQRLKALEGICDLGVNEILFSYWHVLHLPLFILLVFSGLTHVVVVHFY